MSQAPIWSVPLVGPETPTAYAGRDNDSFNALLSLHSGTSRPSYAVASTVWVDIVSATVHNVYYFDGVDDILLYTINPTADTVAPNLTSPVLVTGGTVRLNLKDTNDTNVSNVQVVGIDSAETLMWEVGSNGGTNLRLRSYLGDIILTDNSGNTVFAVDGGTGNTTSQGTAPQIILKDTDATAEGPASVGSKIVFSDQNDVDVANFGFFGTDDLFLQLAESLGDINIRTRNAADSAYISRMTFKSVSASGDITLHDAVGATAMTLAGATGQTTFNARINLKSFTVGTVPSAAVAGGFIYVSNESGGAIPAFSDNTNWRRVSDRAIIS